MAMGEKHGVEIRYKKTDTFSRRMLNSENHDRGLVREIYSVCYQRIGCHSMYNGKFFKCASGPFIPNWLQRIGTEGQDFSSDGVPIHENSNLRQELENYLKSDEPLTACRYCRGKGGS